MARKKKRGDWDEELAKLEGNEVEDTDSPVVKRSKKEKKVGKKEDALVNGEQNETSEDGRSRFFIHFNYYFFFFVLCPSF